MRYGLNWSSLLLLCASLAAQAPLSYQRDAMTPMVAENGAALSHGVNPAGIYSWSPKVDARFGVFLGLLNPNLNQALLDSLVGAGELPDFSNLLAFKLTRFQSLWNPDLSLEQEEKELLEELGNGFYRELTAGIDGLPDRPDELDTDDLVTLTDAKDTLVANLGKADLGKRMAEEFANHTVDELIDLLGPWIGVRFYYELARLQLVMPVAEIGNWGFDIGIRLKAAADLHRQSREKIDFYYGSAQQPQFISVNMPLNFQIYSQVDLRTSFAFAHGEQKEFRWGFSPHLALFGGINHRDLSHDLSPLQLDLMLMDSTEVQDRAIVRLFNSLIGINPGLDAGVIYNFGGLLPALDFLNVGMQVRDLIGMVYQFGGRYPPNYSLDADLGIFLNKKFYQLSMRIFGGAELVAIRGLIEENPYSELLLPAEHLRLLAGVSFFDERIKASLQLYDLFLTPALNFWFGPVRFGFSADFGLKHPAIGFGLQLDFRANRQASFLGIGNSGQQLSALTRSQRQQG